MSEQSIYCVGVYLVDKQYGGPEEGGWWYDAGELITDSDFYRNLGMLPRSFLDEDEAYAYATRLEEKLDETVNIGRPSISSVLSQGIYRPEVREGYLPKHFPETLPQYE